MPRSASARRPLRGFTLFEVMMTVALVATVLLPILTVRATATSRAERASRMLWATHYAEELLAEHARDREAVDELEGFVEENPTFRYELTIEDWDLSTGFQEEDEDDEEQDRLRPAAALGDAGPPGEEDRDDPYKVRRFAIEVFWMAREDDEVEDSILLEGFVPRIWEQPSLMDAAGRQR